MIRRNFRGTLHRRVREAIHSDNSHPADQKFIAQIETHGWNVTNVFRREGETGPEWSFSSGLFHTFQQAEIVIFGLELDNMQKIVNAIGSAIKGEAKFESGNEYQDIFARCGCQFRPVDAGRHADYLGRAIWFYDGGPFPVLQCFWPDREGHYPSDPTCSAGVVERAAVAFQTLLSVTPLEEPCVLYQSDAKSFQLGFLRSISHIFFSRR